MKNIPGDVDTQNTFKNNYNLGAFVKGTIPSIDTLLKNNRFLSTIDTTIIRPLKRAITSIEKFLVRLQGYTGNKNEVWEKNRTDDIEIPKHIKMVHCVAEHCREHVQNTDEVCVYLTAIQIIKLY